MKKTAGTISACVVLIVSAGAGARAAPRRPRTPARPGVKLTPIVTGNNDFALNVYQQLAAGQDGNLFFSPNSIHAALAMTSTGARGNTAAQMSKTLRLPTQNPHEAYAGLLKQLKPPKEGGYELRVANALWGQKGYPWIEEFLKTTKANYDAGLREVDFVTATEAARRTINAWVERQTNQKIKDLLKPGVLKPLTRLVLTNAIYFKGDWASQFDKKLTRAMPFKLSASRTTKAPMMYQKAKFGYTENNTAQILSMPYKGKDLSMLVLLPKKVDGLADMAKKLTAGDLAAFAAKARQREVRVYMPKFKMTSQFSLKQVLTAMGMSEAFVPGKADFSGMNGKKDLFISAVIHKAFVDVNEEGTEAAAATGVVIGLTSVMPPPLVFRADHPFLFVIRHDRTGAILFMGRVMDPRNRSVTGSFFVKPDTTCATATQNRKSACLAPWRQPAGRLATGNCPAAYHRKLPIAIISGRRSIGARPAAARQNRLQIPREYL